MYILGTTVFLGFITLKKFPVSYLKVYTYVNMKYDFILDFEMFILITIYEISWKFIVWSIPSINSRCLSMISSHKVRCLSYLRMSKSRFRTSCSFKRASRCISTLAISNSWTLHKRDKISASSSVLIRLGSSYLKKKRRFYIINNVEIPGQIAIS